MVILLLLLATIQPKWSFEVPTNVRHTSVRGERIGIALDSTVVVIDRSTGTELVRVATHRGVIEGIGLMPGDTTCVVVSARYDSVSKIVVNTVAEVDLRTGEERQQLLLPPVQKQAWTPDVVQTVCAFTHDGAYVYTSTPQFFNGVSTLLEHGNYHKIDLTTFNDVPLERTTGPHGTIELTNDDRIVLYSGSMGALNTSLRIPAWESYQTGLVMIVDQAKVSWKKIGPRIRIAPHSRFLYDSRYLYDTSSFAPSTYPELFGTIDLNGLCHNGKHYYSTPPITIRELGTNKIVSELALTTSDTTFKWWMQINDSLFIIAQDRHVTCWQHDLEAEFPERIVHTLPDTITKNTCLPVTVKALPIGVPKTISISATMGSVRNGTVQFTQVGQQTVVLDTDTHNVVVTPLQLHPKASWGMMIPEARKDAPRSVPRFSNDGHHVAYASERWLALGSLDDSAMYSVRLDTAHSLLGLLESPTGDAYIVRDSQGTTTYNHRGQGSTYETLRTVVLRRNGDTSLTSAQVFQRSYGYHVSYKAHSSWDATYGWVISVITTSEGNYRYVFQYDALSGATINSTGSPLHSTSCFDRDPVTNKMWWLGFTRYAMNDLDYHYAFRELPNGTIDSVWFPWADRLKFVAQGRYLLIDGNLYDRSWQRVGPDATLPNFTGSFLGQRPFALELSRQTARPSQLLIRQLPSGAFIDSIDLGVQIYGVDVTEDGEQIALTFGDGTLQVFATDSLFTHPLLIAPPSDTTTISVKGLMVAPHPMTDGASITIERWNNLPLTYHLSDMNGVEMLRGTIAQSSNVVWLDRRDASSQRLSSGIYLLRITDGTTTMRTTIVVQ